MSKDAEVILVGKVIHQKAGWNENQTRIYTWVTIEIDEFIKGNNGSTSMVVKHPGGEIGEVGELYTHAPTFSKDEEVLLFLEKSKTADVYNVFQGENGKIQLMTDKRTGEKITADRKSYNSVKRQIEKFIRED